jgi:ParB family transcriptional regulator, chromosome partitioning protein
MPDKPQQQRRTNRVFKSLHKPLTYLGVERTLFYFVCVSAVGAFNLFNSILAGIAVFVGGFAFGHWVTNSDPAFLSILAKSERYKLRYDAAKQQVLLIAKLPASQQQEAFSAAFRGQWTSEGNTQVLIPVRELAAWIELNILLQLASAPFDKQDETLVPVAGSCVNCPKRTGFNKLLFPDVRKDSCTSPDCFRAKTDASVKKTLETKPQLIQISAAWNSRDGAPLGRNQYVELEIKKQKANGASTKLRAVQKPCDKMTEAIVMDGGKRGQVVRVCADPACRVHHPNTPSPRQVERERAEERKRIEKEKLAITTRHRVLATILQRVSAPLKKADLLAVAHYLIGHFSYSQIPALAKRHKVETRKDSDSAQELLAKQVSSYDEAELCKLLLEISLLDSAYRRSTGESEDVLLGVAKRYRVDVEKLQKAVAAEFAAKRDKSKAKAKAAA